MEASLNKSDMRLGGHPAMSWGDPRLLMIMKLVAELSFKCTGIFGHSLAGEIYPVHFSNISDSNRVREALL